MTRARLGLGIVLYIAGCAARAPIWNGLDVSSGQAIVLRPDSGAAAPSLAGLYRSPQLGLLSLTQHGAAVRGEFDYPHGPAQVHGTLDGTLEGNLIRFDWRETHSGLHMKQSVYGKGFFLFDPPQGDETRLRLFGRRDYEVLTENQPHGEHTVAIRDGGPIYAVALERDAASGASP